MRRLFVPRKRISVPSDPRVRTPARTVLFSSQTGGNHENGIVSRVMDRDDFIDLITTEAQVGH
jgi:hypothetical protein